MAQKKSTKPSRTKASKVPAEDFAKKEAEIKADASSASVVVDNILDKLTEEIEETTAKAASTASQVKEKAAAAKKTVTEKASKAKDTVKKDISSAKETAKATASQETYFEIAGEQILMEDINERIRQAWLAEGHYPSRLKSVKTYLNIEERRAYYVINGKAENKYVEF